MEPRVLAIFLATAKGAPMLEVPEAHAVPGLGLEGDRYFNRIGTFSGADRRGREVTLFEAEVLESVVRDYNIDFPARLSRRNLLVRGAYLNHLVEREFEIGAVRVLGARLCEPCDYLERLSGREGLKRALVHRGGLRCEILSPGYIHVGDAIRF
jgi:MOSC domain-containing protein YiiM